jgi:hypothetical protein
MSNLRFIIEKIEKLPPLSTEQLNIIESCIENIKNTDEQWINICINFFLDFYQNIANKEIYKNFDERKVKDGIIEYYSNSRNYSNKFTLTLESKSKNTERVGYYDFLFQSILWESNERYFAVEAKCLDGTKTSHNEYIHCHKSKELKGSDEKIQFPDGGVYRFLSLKYSEDMGFGGMLAFVQKGKMSKNISDIKSRLRDLKIKDEKTNHEFGENLDENLFNRAIDDYPHSFQSRHERYYEGTGGESILLYHIFMDFT